MINNAVFGKTMENVKKYRDITLFTTERTRNYLVSEPNYHTAKFFTKDLLAIEMRKTEILMNKPVCLGLSILELRAISTYEFRHIFLKPDYDEKEKLCFMDTDIFIVYIKTNNINKYIAVDVETRFDTSNYEFDRPLPKGKNKKVIGLIKDELSQKIMTKCVALRVKTYNYLVDDDSEEEKKKKGRKNCGIKRKLIKLA